jgi:hypothetical protein
MLYTVTTVDRWLLYTVTTVDRWLLYTVTSKIIKYTVHMSRVSTAEQHCTTVGDMTSVALSGTPCGRNYTRFPLERPYNYFSSLGGNRSNANKLQKLKFISNYPVTMDTITV